MKKPKVEKKCEHTWELRIAWQMLPDSNVPEGETNTPYVLARCSKCFTDIHSDEIEKLLNIYAKGF